MGENLNKVLEREALGAGKYDPSSHPLDCEYHVDQNPSECTCGVIPRTARLVGELSGGFRWCIFPCQKLDEKGRNLARECRVSVDPRFNGQVWQQSGSPDAPSLTPSVDCMDKPCWHGAIVNGELKA